MIYRNKGIWSLLSLKKLKYCQSPSTYRLLMPNYIGIMNHTCSILSVLTKYHRNDVKFLEREYVVTHSRLFSSTETEKLIPLFDKLCQQYESGNRNNLPTFFKHMSTSSEKIIEKLVSQVTELRKEKLELLQLESETHDKEMKELAKKDIQELNIGITELQEQIIDIALHELGNEDIADFILEVSAGVGGQEAMLFAQEILKMYYSYCLNSGWNVEAITSDETELGGIRKGCIVIKDKEAYKYLKYEGGIHRVQRTPKTEKSGRLHTSTASVAVIPQPSEIMIIIDPKDLKWETMRATGAGGQHVNKTDSAVRLTHLPTGIVVECQVSRSQNQNRKEAMNKLRAKLYQIQLDKQESEYSSTRKLQVGTRARSEKIRTYNYPQDRVTDHRLSLSVYSLPDILAGGPSLNKLIKEVADYGMREKLNGIMEAELKR